MPINWKVSLEDTALIERVADRVMRVSNLDWDATHLQMDLTACHNNGCPLRLQDMLDAKPFDLMHDILGINRHINRETGQLEDSFVPRFAV